MAGNTIGKLSEFDPTSDSVSAYVERANLFFEANEIAAAKRVAVFLSAIGGGTYSLLRNLLAPTLPREKTLDEIVDVLTKHYEPKTLVIAERFQFHRRNQAVGESVNEYVAELRRLTKHCEFGAYLDDALRDRFVCGLRSETIQKKLLTETDLSFQRAVDIAHTMESAAENARKLQSPSRAAVSVPHARNIGKVSSNGQGEATNSNCYRCGKSTHKAAQCPFRTAKCHNCGKIGHLKRVCRQSKKPVKSPGTQRSQSRQNVQLVEEDANSEILVLYHDKSGSNKPLEVDLQLEGKPLRMEVDTGAAVSLVSEMTYRSLFPTLQLQPSMTKLRTYSGEPLTVLGQQEVKVQHGEQTAQLSLLVVQGEGPSLLGRNWLRVFRLDWNMIHQLSGGELQELLDRHGEVFQVELGTLRGYEAKIHVEPGAKPRFCKARTVPYALRKKVEQELERLTKEGIIEPIQFADWAAPIVPVMKKDGTSLRICGDFKVTVNQVSKLDKYPIPKIDDLFAQLAGGKRFTKLDMSQAYQQLVLEEDSRKYVVINTHRGLFRYNRLPFGISSAPGIFQRVMESLLSGIPGVVVYIDDVLVTGKTQEEHLKALDEALGRMREAGLRLKKDKCVFLAPSVVYLGHRIDEQGLHPVAEKLQALQEAPRPTNVSELKSYLGLLTYYAKFLPNLSTVLAPLYRLLKHQEVWKWLTEQEKAFQKSKELMMCSQLLVHFDPKLEIRLACDASAYGVGAVLSHKMPDGSEKPVGFASRTLTETEKKYSQVEKEALACVYGVKHFHAYLLGHKFVLQTDHEPLRTLFSESKVVPPHASSRIQRWAWTLASYEYSIVCRKTGQHANADAMSRLPLPYTPDETSVPEELVLMVEGLQDAPITAFQIARWTRRDPLMARVTRCILEGWPRSPDEELRPYWTKRLELSTHDGCIVWGGRVVIPPPAREHLLVELHGGHPGVSRMKALARSLMWWPGMDHEIEDMVRHCTECQRAQASPAAAPLHPWKWPTRPWARLHVDFAGPMDGRMYLIVVDAHSKWLEVLPMTTATALTTIQHLRTLFARFGVPESLVSDNGSQFTAEEFQLFCKQNGIRHIQVAPYHPASNGLAERAVQTFKRGIQKFKSGTVGDRIARFLMQYRVTPHTTTGSSPAELLLGRRLRTRLDAIRPNLERQVEAKLLGQKENYDKRARERTFTETDRVYVRNFGRGETWLPGDIVQTLGPVSFQVRLTDGRLVRRHQNQIRKRTDVAVPDMSKEDDDVLIYPEAVPVPASPMAVPSCDSGTAQSSLTETTRRYPSRTRNPPTRYSDCYQ